MKKLFAFLVCLLLILSHSVMGGLGGSSVGGTESGGSADPSITNGLASVTVTNGLAGITALQNGGISLTNQYISVNNFGTNYFQAWGHAAYGGTDTVVMRPLSYQVVGSGWVTVTTNAANAATYTILKNGYYGLTITVNSPLGVGQFLEVTRNASGSDLTTSGVLDTSSSNKVLCASGSPGATGATGNPSAATTVYLQSNDVVRAQGSGVPNTTVQCLLRINQLLTQ